MVEPNHAPPAAQNHPPGMTSGLRSAIKTGTDCLQIGLCSFSLCKSHTLMQQTAVRSGKCAGRLWAEFSQFCEQVTALLVHSVSTVHRSPLF